MRKPYNNHVIWNLRYYIEYVFRMGIYFTVVILNIASSDNLYIYNREIFNEN